MSGLFWGEPTSKGPRAPTVKAACVSPPIPSTGWLPPSDFPDLSQYKIISIDVETCDPNLRAKGPGFVRGESFVAGLAVGAGDRRWYFPVRHEGGGNMDPATVFRWAAAELGRASQPKVGHNLIYDLEALAYEGVEVAGELYDTMLAEPLLDENKFSYSLASCAQTHLNDSKTDALLYDWLARAYGGQPTRDAQAGRIWQAPASLVGPYGEGDVDLPLRILQAQGKRLKAEGLYDLFLLECSLLPVLLAMRLRGVRVDVAKAEQVSALLKARVKATKKQLHAMCGPGVNVNAPESFVRFLDKEGIPYPRTPKSKAPSITTAWLEKCPHPIGKLILDARKYTKLDNTFLTGYIIDSHVKGRVYGQFHQLRNDTNGTISGRFSSSNPNLENIPKRDETAIEIDEEDWKLGKLIRSCFLPDEDEDFCADDYSQVEYRGIVHYGTGPSAERCRELYQKDPETDFHNLVVEWTGLPRSRAKGINFGKSYGMKAATAARQMGCDIETAKEFIALYDKELPFVEELLTRASKTAEQRGYVTTILGRRARFTLWEVRNWETSKKDGAMAEDKAREKYGNAIRRARCYTALNRIVQGGCADIFKKALSVNWKAGVFAQGALGAPLNLVHDETNTSRRRDKVAVEAHREMLYNMENCVKLSVPLIVSPGVGPNWGETK